MIDFGVARVDEGAGLTTAHTMTGQIIGTVQYMSPEQCDGDPNAVDVRSDVYSLGVILYELLTGTLPYLATSTSLVAATRAIREQEPARPSTINRKLRGDIETVVLKALEKDRTRRYQSAEALARDIRHVLNREPIEARKATLLEKVVKWLVRHPVAVTVGFCGLILALTGALTSVAVWLVLRWPDHVQSDQAIGTAGFFNDHARRIVQLRSKGGYPLANWYALFSSGAGPPPVHTPILSDDRLPGRRLLIIAEAGRERSPERQRVAAYDVDDNLEVPYWEQKLNATDLPERLRERHDWGSGDIFPVCVLLADVFAERAGNEVVSLMKFGGTSHTALQVHDVSNGNVLRRFWMDVQIMSVVWASEARVLVLAGRNGTATWNGRELDEPVADRGDRVANHPIVVFAIRPRPGKLSTDYLPERTQPDCPELLWYWCVWPPEASDTFAGGPSLTLRASTEESTVRDSVNLSLETDVSEHLAGSVFLLLDAQSGQVIRSPDSTPGYSIQMPRDPNDRSRTMPPPSYWSLRELPPLKEPRGK